MQFYKKLLQCLQSGYSSRNHPEIFFLKAIPPVLEVLTPVGPAPRSLDFRVEAIFWIEMYEYDARYAYVSLPAARRFFELEPNEVSGIQIRTADPERSGAVGARVEQLVSAGDKPSLAAMDWKRRNETLFAALKLERVVAFVVLVFIILVASFSVVNTLTMSVIEKRKEISILMTMIPHNRDLGTRLDGPGRWARSSTLPSRRTPTSSSGRRELSLTVKGG